MIDYATWCAIRDGVEKHLTADQLATALSLDVKTVRRWIGRPYAQRQSARRDSKLDPFKGRIVRWLETQAPQPPRRHSYRFRRDWKYLEEKLEKGDHHHD